MTDRPKILQGTDGIRGRIAANEKLQGSSPISFFLESGFLTPEFFERYCHAFACCLIKTGYAKASDRIVIGWDPRDREGSFNQAAISGLRKAGLVVIVAGTLPTPAIPLYMLSISAVAAVVLTASHNPSDQNGIKLFFGSTALKLLPPDDEMLTKMIYDQESINLHELKETGFIESHENKARKFFIEYCTSSRNSWINDNTDLSDTTLVIDASKGAVATVAEDIFESISCRNVFFTNLEGNINEHCGVADIEGTEEVLREDVFGDGAKFASYETLKKLFSVADELKDSDDTSKKIIGLVFDGDGDRCYRLDYSPQNDKLIVSSGDHLGIHQAKYLKTQKSDSDSLFVNTVESDLKTAISARNLGYEPVLTGVGDKWILSRAVSDMIQGALNDSTPALEEFNRITQSDELSGLELSAFWRSMLEKPEELNPSPSSRFAIGIEESGHSITPGYLTDDLSELPSFSGNGIKSGLNSLVATRQMYTDENWFQSLEAPYDPGIKSTFYTYYVDKSLILPGSPFRDSFKKLLLDCFHDYFPKSFELEFVEFAEEKPMLYCSITESGEQIGAIFIRNSGTEDKSALYLRGEKQLEGYLNGIGEKLHLKMLTELKIPDNEFTTLELILLQSIRDSQELEEISEQNRALPVERVLKEIEFKEKLIVKEGQGYKLTQKGLDFLAAWAEKH